MTIKYDYAAELQILRKLTEYIPEKKFAIQVKDSTGHKDEGIFLDIAANVLPIITLCEHQAKMIEERDNKIRMFEILNSAAIPRGY